MLLLLEAQEGNWDEIDLMVRAFQGATMALKTSAVPVVAAPAGLALGGGCEVCLHADRVQAAAETYMGLVEVGVGLIPAGGGTKGDAAARRRSRRRRRSWSCTCRPRSRRWPSRKVSTSARGREAARLSARCRRRHDEPRAACWPTPKAARSSRAATAISRPRSGTPCRSAAPILSRALARRAPGAPRRPDQRPRCAHRPQAGVDPRRRRPARIARRSAKRTSWTSNAKRF